jgi:hypothetical protein
MSTAYLFPSTLQGLADVSVSPGVGQDGYPLIWSNSLGKWVISLLPYSSLSGAPTLGTMAAQNANAVAITGGSASGLTNLAVTGPVSQTRENLATIHNSFTYSNTVFHFPQFVTWRSRGSISAPIGVNTGDYLLFVGSQPRGNAGWSTIGTGFYVRADENASSAPNNLVRCRIVMAGVNAAQTDFSEWVVFRHDRANFQQGTESSSTTTGTIIVNGGIGISGNLHVGGQINGRGAVQSGTPASATAAGTQGQIRWDANYIYVCTATNTWKRVVISPW